MARSLSLLFAALLVANACASPLLLWSSETMIAPKHMVRAGHETALSEVQSFLQKDVNSGLVVVFMQDRLSMADITMYGGVHGESFFPLKNTQAAFEGAKSAFAVPSVATTESLATVLSQGMLARATGKTFFVASANDATSLSLNGVDASSLNVILAHLPNVMSNGVLSTDKLTDNDALIGSLLSTIAMQYDGPLTCLFAATSSASAHTHHTRRSAPQVTTGNIPGLPVLPSLPPFPTFQPQSFPLPITRPITKSYLYFTIPLFMGLMTMFLLIFFILWGAYGISLVQTPQRWADPNDKCLTVPEN